MPQKILTGQTGGWKGRAQQLHSLKMKLRDALSNQQHRLTDTPVVTSPTKHAVDERSLADLRKIEADKRATLDKCLVDLQKSNTAHKALQVKYGKLNL